MTIDKHEDAWEIVGAKATWQGSAPFLRAIPLVKRGDEYAFANRYLGEHMQISGVNSEELLEWDCRFKSVPLEKYAEVWIFRKGFPFLEDAQAEMVEAGILIQDLNRHEDIDWAVVRCDEQAQTLLREWCDRGADEAVEAGARVYGTDLLRMCERAMNCASLSFSLCNAPAKTGLYLAILEVVGRTEWHNQTSAMIESTRGHHFFQAAVAHKNNVLVRVYKNRAERLELENDRLRSGEKT